MSDVTKIWICISINIVCLIIVLSITIYNFVKAYRLIRAEIKDMRREKELEELEVLKEIE